MTARNVAALAALVALGFVASSAISYCAGKRAGGLGEKLERDTRLAETARADRIPVADAATRADARVEAGRPAVDLSHRLAGILDATTLEIRVTPSGEPARVTVPPAVVVRLVQDSLQLARAYAAIDSLSQLRAKDSVALARQDTVITDLRALKTPKCGATCGATITATAITVVLVVAHWLFGRG